ncbi:MAG: MFS transporter, partial [Actinomycetes bacterium]
MTAAPRRTRSAWVLALACAVTFVVVMDATIVSVALPDIRADLGFAPATLPWVVNAYTLAFAGFLLLGGRIADIAGRRETLIAGTVVFTVFRSVCGLTGDPAVLLVARTLQGVGGALLIPATLALVTTTFTTPAARARALGMWSAAGGIGAALGPVVGGLLIGWAGWRWVFHVTLPVGVAVVVGAALVLPRTAPRSVRPRIDLTGALLGTAGLLGMIFAIMRSAVATWAEPDVWGPLAAGVLLLGAFLRHQARTPEPLMPLDLFAERAVSSANAVMFLLGLGFFASPVLLSLYLQDVLGWPPLLAGLGYLPVGVAMFAGAGVAGQLTLRFGARGATVGCAAIGAVGLAGTAVALAVDGSFAAFVGPAALFGFGTAAS